MIRRRVRRLRRRRRAGRGCRGRRVAAQLLLTAHDATVGDLRPPRGFPEERRELLDRTREAAGLPTTKVVEERQAFEFANRPETQLRDANGRFQALCPEPGCPNFEPGPMGPGSSSGWTRTLVVRGAPRRP